MENFASSTFAKILVGSAFLVGGGIYLYNSFIKKNEGPKNQISDFVENYIEKIKEMIHKDQNWQYNLEILCHLNFIIDEVTESLLQVNENKIINERIHKVNDENEWEKMAIEYIEIKKKMKKKVIDEYIINLFEIDVANVSSALNFKLKNFDQNKNFTKLFKYDENEIEDVINKINDKLIDDCIFFASVKQIEYDKFIQQKMYSFNESDIRDIEIFELKIKDEFMNKFGFEPKYLYELLLKKEGDNAEKMILLINRVIY